MIWDGDSAPMFTEFAQALGIDEQTLISELQSGKTLAQLAQEKGVDLATVTTAAQTTMKQHLDELVAAGRAHSGAGRRTPHADAGSLG